MKYIITLLIAFSLPIGGVLGETLPENARIESYGNNWVCKHGFEKQAKKCVAISPPENAHIDSSGLGWECNRRYYKKTINASVLASPRMHFLKNQGLVKNGSV